GAGSDALVGPGVANTWNITGANAGTVGKVRFGNVESLYGGAKDDTFVFGPAGSVASLDGGAGNDTLVAANRDHLCTVNGVNRGALDNALFGNIENLVGGAGQDRFRFAGQGGVVRIDGGGAAGQGDWLDYSRLSAPVTVNLSMGSASRVGNGAGGAL